MRHLICAIFVMCLVTPAITAEAGLSQDSISALAGPAGELRLPDRPLAMTNSADSGGLAQYAQNLETGAQPEAVGNGTQPSAATPRADSDGFQGGNTFEYFDDQRPTQNKNANVFTGTVPEPPDQSDMEHYNLMMKAWQKGQK